MTLRLKKKKWKIEERQKKLFSLSMGKAEEVGR